MGSNQSSLGLFRTEDTYIGGQGYSLRLEGLEPGVNDRAMERRVVVHGADYADPSVVGELGRLGRSHGCLALPRHGAPEQRIEHADSFDRDLGSYAFMRVSTPKIPPGRIMSTSIIRKKA